MSLPNLYPEPSREEMEKIFTDYNNQGGGLILEAIQNEPNKSTASKEIQSFRNAWINFNDLGKEDEAKQCLTQIGKLMMDICDDFVADQVNQDLEQWERNK